MPLHEYKRKRDFTKSPEPAGDEERSRRERQGKARFFCVQKHAASSLHYDFRLEHDGVLLSWAVPKGPSLDPSVKRLAMHVEDHPIEYGTFEGVIPEGYGAGVVMLWDQGTWSPETPDVDAALKKGDLKFTLDGYKLKGSWVLVRTRGYGGRGGDADSGKSWLLIKHRDEWSGDLDIAEFAPLSVKSNQDLHEILAEDTPAQWVSHRGGGDASGAVLRSIISRAAALKAERAGAAAPSSSGRQADDAEESTPAARPRRSTAKRTTRAASSGSKSSSSRKRTR